MTDSKAARTLLRERVLDQIMRAILDGTLRPGARLRDDELIAWLGTSRAPIREALTQLADIGLVEMAPNRFTKVAEVTPRLYAESTAVWAALATRGMNHGILRFPAEQLPVLEALRDEQADFDPVDFPDEPTVVDRFVGTILQHCPNQVLLDAIAVHAPLLQLGVNQYKGFMKSEPIVLFFTSVIRRCRDHDVEGFEEEVRSFLGGPMTNFVETMTGFEYYDLYGDKGASRAGS
jgi:DNA-binding GntR family transcriptional regulator